MEQKIVGLYKDISQFIIGVLVEETEEKIVLRRAFLTTVEKDPNNASGVVPNFIPITLLTLKPPFHVMGLLKEKNIDFPLTFWKKNCLTGLLEIEDGLKIMYERNFLSQFPPALPPETPTEKIPEVIKLF